jgi:hypothetical protein
MPVGCLVPGILISTRLEAAVAFRVASIFLTLCGPLIWLNRQAPKEQTVPVTPLMRCHEVIIDLRPPLLTDGLIF